MFLPFAVLVYRLSIVRRLAERFSPGYSKMHHPGRIGAAQETVLKHTCTLRGNLHSEL